MDRTTPVGSHVVIDEILDPQNLAITSRMNGETLQDDNTGMMIRSVADLVSFVSSRVTLTPGDIIATRTLEGVSAFQDILLYLDDTVELRSKVSKRSSTPSQKTKLAIWSFQC